MENSNPFFSNEAGRTLKTIADPERIVAVVTDSVAQAAARAAAEGKPLPEVMQVAWEARQCVGFASML